MLRLMRSELSPAARHLFSAAAVFVAGAVGCGSAFTSATGDGGTNGGDASAGGDAAGAVDGGAGRADASGGDSGGAAGDSGVTGGGAGGGVQCGPNKSCVKGESCCVYDNNSNFSYICRQTSGCPSGSNGASVAELACTNTADCGGIGHACCIERQSGSSFVAFCAASCPSPQAQMCSPSAGVTACVGPPCSNNNIDQWGLPDLYGTCGGQSP